MPSDPPQTLAHPIERRTFRIDSAPSLTSAAGRGASGSLLGHFRVRPGLVAPDRRAEERHEEIEGRAWIGWRTWRGFVAPHALIVNISRGGAMIFVDMAPPERKPVWIFLETPGLKTIVKAKVVEITATRAGQCAVRVAFDAPCPYGAFDAAVCGMNPADPKRRMHLKGRTPNVRPAALHDFDGEAV